LYTMHCKIKNQSDLDMSRTLPLVKSLYSYAQKQMGFKNAADIVFQTDPENAEKDLGRTAHYHPDTHTVTIYTDRRHIKDILRSIAHELVHHDQNCNGAFKEPFESGPGYAQKDNRLRNLERDAYERGNMIFRDWEDTYKQALNETNYYRKEKTKMSQTINEQTLRNIIRKVLQEKFSKNTENTLNENLTKEVKEVKTSDDDWYNGNLYESLKKRWTK
jgi:signal recognition particle GTPase